LAIEYNGLYWHSSEWIESGSHLRKGVACKEAGIRLLVIYDDDWANCPDEVERAIRDCLDGAEPPKTYTFYTDGKERFSEFEEGLLKVESYES
jgi:hypothetical protein